jgi:hypothetical protein
MKNEPKQLGEACSLLVKICGNESLVLMKQDKCRVSKKAMTRQTWFKKGYCLYGCPVVPLGSKKQGYALCYSQLNGHDA